MHRINFVAAATLVVIGATVLASNAQTPHTRADEEAIMVVINSTTDAFNRRDTRTWLRHTTEDAELVTARGAMMKGAAAIEKGLTALFEGRNRNASVKTLAVTFRLVRPDIALVHVTNEISGVVEGGEVNPPHQEISLRVLMKDRGVWRMAGMQITAVR
jgi:uncharacterized protein (TIGR02246 family)